jgi:hypothetical protein
MHHSVQYAPSVLRVSRADKASSSSSNSFPGVTLAGACKESGTRVENSPARILAADSSDSELRGAEGPQPAIKMRLAVGGGGTGGGVGFRRRGAATRTAHLSPLSETPSSITVAGLELCAILVSVISIRDRVALTGDSGTSRHDARRGCRGQDRGSSAQLLDSASSTLELAVLFSARRAFARASSCLACSSAKSPIDAVRALCIVSETRDAESADVRPT